MDGLLLLFGLMLILIDGKFVFNRVDKKPYGSDQPTELRIESCAYQCLVYTYTKSFCYGFYFGEPIEGDKPFLSGNISCAIRLKPTPPEVSHFYELDIFQDESCSLCSHEPTSADTVKNASEGFNNVLRGHLGGKFYAVHTEVNDQGVSNAADISSIDCRFVYCPSLGMRTVQVFSEEENKFLQDLVNTANNGPAQFSIGGGYKMDPRKIIWWYPEFVQNTNFMPWEVPPAADLGCTIGVGYKWRNEYCLCPKNSKQNGCIDTAAACVCEIDAMKLL